MTEFTTLEYDIKEYLNGNHSLPSLEISHPTAQRIITLAKNVATHTLDMVDHKARQPKDPKDTSIRMSELGEPCHRKLIYKWYKPEYGTPPYAERPEPFLPVKFTYGDYIEELTLFLCAEAGHTVKDRQKEVRLTPSVGKWYAIGHIDAKIDGHIVDVKSAADGSFSKYKREGLTEENDTFGYLWQLDGYAVAENVDTRAFIFTNKHDGNLHIIDRTGEPLLPIEEMVIAKAIAAENYLEMGGLPERMPTKETKYGSQLGTVCSYCAFKWACYDGNITGIISSGKPMYFDRKTLTTEGLKLAKEKTTIAPPETYNW